MYKSFIIITVFFLQFIVIAPAQAQDSRGRDFVVTFLPNYHQVAFGLEKNDSLSLYVTGVEGTTGNINYRDLVGLSFNQTFTIPASGAYIYQLYWKNFELQGFMQDGISNIFYQNNQIAPQSFRITTDNDVSVYALNKTYKSSDATIVFPVNVLGKEYITASYNSDEPNNPNINEINQNSFTPSEFAVVATENNTHIEFELTAKAFLHSQNSFSRDINAGDVFLVQAERDSLGSYRDLTGSYLKSDKPIAVFAGHQRALLPKSYVNKLASRDQLFEQMLPISALGKIYIITPFAKPMDDAGYAYDIYRIIAAYDSTAISVDGTLKGIYDKGEFYEGRLDKAYLVTSSKDVLAAQYKKSTGLASYDGSIPGTYNGDPFMLIVPPKKQFLTEYITYNIQAMEIVGTSGVDIYDEQYVTIISPKAYTTSITMDGMPIITSGFINISNTCYAYASFPVAIGAHQFKGEKPFGVYVYGYGGADSYGYNGGMSFRSFDEVVPEAFGEKIICPGDSAKLSAVGCVEIYWTPQNTLDNPYIQTPIAYPKKTTWYSAYMTDSLGCVYIDSVKITVVPSPLIDAGKDTTLCIGEFTVLKPSGGVDYFWDYNPNLSCTHCENPSAKPTKSSWYYVTAEDIDGCGGRDSVYITIRPAPPIDAGKDSVFCLGNSLEFRPSGGTYYTWDYNPSLSCTDCDNPIASPVKKTTYYVTGYNQFGCSARDSITLDVFPSVLIEAGKDTSICYANVISLSATGGVSYVWDYNSSLSNLNTPNPVASPTRDELYFVTAVDSNGCIGRDSIKVTVYPDFTLSVSNDTTLCTGKKAILKANGAYKYHWEPSDKVLCDSCDYTESIIDSSITFYVTGQSIDGCKKIDSIHITAVNCGVSVNDLVYPLDVYCYDENSPCKIANIGQLPLRLDSLVLDGVDKMNFRILHTGEYPLIIPVAEDYQFAVEFHPEIQTNYSAYIRAYSNLDKVDTIHITAEKRIANLKLSATMTGGSKPDDTCSIILSIASADWSRLDVRYLNLRLKYKYFKFFANENYFEICGGMPTNWDINAKSEYDTDKQLEIWDISLNGLTKLQENTCLTLIKPIYMLHSNVYYDIEVSGAVPEHDICLQIESTNANINLNYCVDTLRAVKIGEGDFGYDIQNQICSKGLNAQAHLPFAANVEISIIDILGQENTIFKGRLDQGYTQLEHDLSNYQSGVYFLYFKSGQVIITKKIIINTN
jgi:hypothetical protein